MALVPSVTLDALQCRFRRKTRRINPPKSDRLTGDTLRIIVADVCTDLRVTQLLDAIAVNQRNACLVAGAEEALAAKAFFVGPIFSWVEDPE